MAANLPVTSCECYRSISTMKRLNNYRRCIPWAKVGSPHWLSCISSTMCLSIWTKLSIHLKTSTRGWCNCKVCFRNEIVLLWVDNLIAHVVASVHPSDLVLYVVKIIPPLKMFLNRRFGFDKWSLERRQAGNTILRDLGDTCLIHIDVWRCFQYKDSGFGELGGLSFCSEIPCSTRRVL